ncbi:phage portal protein [Microterricola viridarii]|uniref:phage portal protein n=1 Tax=Microterricola viridarii TaxID=412690 RepID=UPI0009F1D107|nr:phage portal protein [Microterricola viridarii]
MLPEAETLDVVVRTGVEWLTVEFYPNMLPNPVWDKKGELANMGRSDYFGIEPLFARINSIWSSLMRDFDNGMGRLTVPESYLKLNGPGRGAEFDLGRQVYSPIGGLVDDGKGGQITISQFKIRVAEHLDTIEGLKRQIANSCGYSVSHFGIHDTGTKTATEVNDDSADSERTRDKKALYVRPALPRLARTALAIDALVFPGRGGQKIDDLPVITFAEVSQVDPLARAQTVQMLDAARAVSTLTKVRMAQPLLNSTEAQTEADTIREENGLGPVLDPTQIID